MLSPARTLIAALLVCAALPVDGEQAAPAAPPSPQAVPPATPIDSPPPAVPDVDPRIDLEALRLQVMLDRAGFSVGVIDAQRGAQTKRAQAAYERQSPSGPPAVDPLATYTITPQDTAGPFVPAIPPDLVQQAALASLGYTSIVEALSERFHTTPAFLERLNPGAQFAAGEQIRVPNVEPLIAPVERPELSPEAAAAARQERAGRPAGTSGRGSSVPRQPNTVAMRPDVTVRVSRGDSVLTVTDPDGRALLFAPVSTGSQQDPLPLGEWKVNGIQFNPTFNYNPDLFWDADPSHSKARLPAGPNSPVGLVWIDLSKEHYGLHGTPEPAAVGRTQSHGCVRLTNWDALKLAGLVKPGTRVVFTE